MALDLAWEFNTVLPGTFSRNTQEPRAAARSFSLVGPPPTSRYTLPLSNAQALPPYLYLAFAQDGGVCYVGKATDQTLKSVLQRWIRPGKATGTYCWAHGTRNKEAISTVAHIADALIAGRGPIRLWFSSYIALMPLVLAKASRLGISTGPIAALTPESFIHELERELIFALQPPWNITGKAKRRSTPLADAAFYWRDNVAHL